jgi:4-amino-4-deoxy-L-arabinose transferase-like glycosyltransferase
MFPQNNSNPDFDIIPQKWAKYVLILIFLLAFIARLDLIRHHKLPFGDNDGTNLEVARNLLQGKGFVSERKWLYFKNQPETIFNPITNRQPLIIVILAACFKITGISFYCGKITILIIGLLALYFSYKISKLWFSRDVAILSTFIIAINPTQIWFSSSIDDQMLFQLLLFITLFFYYKYDLFRTESSYKDLFFLGLLIGLSFLSRNNGLLVMAALGIDLFLRFIKPKFWKKMIIGGIVVWLGFITSAGWWMVRNYAEFGSPFFTDNSLFLYNEDMFKTVWEVRDNPPAPGDFFRAHTIEEIIKREIQGFYRIVEPFLMGNIFHNELFSQGNMCGFILFAFVLLLGFNNFPRHRFTILIALFHFLLFAAHQHVFRYLMPFYVLGYILGTAGFVKTFKYIYTTGNILGHTFKSKTSIIVSFLLIFLILLFPHIRPLRSTYEFNDTEEYNATMKVIDWLKENVKKGECIMEYRFLERLIYLYDIPTLIIPNNDFKTIMDVAREYNANYFIIYHDILRYRYGLSEKWFVKNGKIYSQELPNYMDLVFEDPSESYLVYRLNWNENSDE